MGTDGGETGDEHAGPPTAVPGAGTSAWYQRQAPLAGDRWRVRCLFSDDHGDGTIVDGTDELPDRFEIWRADVDRQGRPRVLVNPDAAPGSPTMWFVALPELRAERPAMVLVGYEHDVVAPGTVVPDTTFFHLPTRNRDQVGAIRWWRDEAIVDQVYVGERWRRRHVATALIYAASAYHQLHGWPGRLHSDGRRTSMGEQLVAGLRHPDRIASLDRLLPPMDRPGESPADG